MPAPRRAFARKLLDHELPAPVYAAVGLIDRVKHEMSRPFAVLDDPEESRRSASAPSSGPGIGGMVSLGIQAPVAVVTTAWRLTNSLTGTPGALTAAAQHEYDELVGRGQVRSVEIAAERAVRKRVSRFEDSIAPRAARATVRWNERRQRWGASPAARRAAEARRRARRAAQRFSEFNAPVLEDDEPRAE